MLVREDHSRFAVAWTSIDSELTGTLVWEVAGAFTGEPHRSSASEPELEAVLLNQPRYGAPQVASIASFGQHAAGLLFEIQNEMLVLVPIGEPRHHQNRSASLLERRHAFDEVVRSEVNEHILG